MTKVPPTWENGVREIPNTQSERHPSGGEDSKTKEEAKARLSLGTQVKDEGGEEVPELVRVATVGSCAVDPVPAMAAALEAYVGRANALGDVAADCGYSHRVPENWAYRVRALGGRLVSDLHPPTGGPRGPTTVPSALRLRAPGRPLTSCAASPPARQPNCSSRPATHAASPARALLHASTARRRSRPPRPKATASLSATA